MFFECVCFRKNISSIITSVKMVHVRGIKRSICSRESIKWISLSFCVSWKNQKYILSFEKCNPEFQIFYSILYSWKTTRINMTVTQSLFSGTFRLLVWFQYPKELLGITVWIMWSWTMIYNLDWKKCNHKELKSSYFQDGLNLVTW